MLFNGLYCDDVRYVHPIGNDMARDNVRRFVEYDLRWESCVFLLIGGVRRRERASELEWQSGGRREYGLGLK